MDYYHRKIPASPSAIFPSGISTGASAKKCPFTGGSRAAAVPSGETRAALDVTAWPSREFARYRSCQ